MTYIIQINDTYIPENFGHGVYEHTADIDKAWRFETKDKAEDYLSGYINPPCFWEGERAHNEIMRKRAANWRIQIIESNTHAS